MGGKGQRIYLHAVQVDTLAVPASHQAGQIIGLSLTSELSAMKIVKRPQDVIADAERLPQLNAYYQESYRAYVRFFADKDEIVRDDLLIAIGLVYSWMQRIPRVNVAGIDSIIPHVDAYRKTGNLNESDITEIISVVNNSIVGTSKLLHFIRPDKTPIWDSRVYRYLTGKEPYYNQMSKLESFFSYIEFCEEIEAHSKCENLIESVASKIGYRPTTMRSIELVMFSHGT